MSIKVLVADTDPRATAWLEAELNKEGYAVGSAVTGAEAIDKAINGRPDLLIFDPSLPDLSGPEICQRLRQDRRSESILIVAFGTESKQDELVACLEAGADEYLVKRCTRAELVARLKALLRCSARLRDAAGPKPKGNVISFFSAKGGTGTSSMCVNLAACVKDITPSSSVLIVDMVLPLGSISAMLGVRSQDTIIELTCERDQPLDHFTIDSYIVPTVNGLHVLLGANDPAEAQRLQFDQVEPLFHTLRGMYDYVFVDFGRALSRVSLPIIQRSDCVALVLSPDRSSVELTKSCLRFFLSTHVVKQRLFPIMNLAVGRQGMSRRDVEEELQIPIDGFVPYSEDSFTTSINQGTPFVYSFQGHFATVAIREMARRLLGKITQTSFGASVSL